MWQEIIVGLVIAVAALHASARFLPAAWRRRIVHFLSQRGFNQDKTAKFFRTSASCGSGCGSCGSCDSDSGAGGKGAGGSSGPTPPSSSSGGPARRVITLHVQR
ncbi:DUF6587 family protein [Massilia sp. BJB1822]|uniref:DUF6587 family protein n=1 Tax=Massilia sp. BJB1822 TaxID=2744470 RepID=UPI001592D7B9|nr:DUF6587 family protein [Massilia sp. BJB1822]NVE00735.1 hypothetical protein [Massilia sp. BJB1822]